MTTEELFHFSSKLSHKKPNHIVSSSATSVLFSIQWNENTGTLFSSVFWSVVSGPFHFVTKPKMVSYLF